MLHPSLSRRHPGLAQGETLTREGFHSRTWISTTAIIVRSKTSTCRLYGVSDGLYRPVRLRKVDAAAHLNRIYDLYPNQRANGDVPLDNPNILAPSQDLNLLRANVGMVFQKPTPFPMSIFENIAFGISLYE